MTIIYSIKRLSKILGNSSNWNVWEEAVIVRLQKKGFFVSEIRKYMKLY